MLEQFERFKAGVHTGVFEVQSLSSREVREVLRGLEAARLTVYLRRYPLQMLQLGVFPDLSSASATGAYSAGLRRIRLNIQRPPHTYKQEFISQRTWAISHAGTSLIQAMSRSLVHEAGHHLFDAAPLEVQELVFRTYLETRRENAFVTPQAAQNYLEYFSECLSAYSFERYALRNSDKRGFAMIEEIRRSLEVNP